MKTWLMELCPEIAEWQVDAIEAYHESAVKLAREALVQELVAGSGEPEINVYDQQFRTSIWGYTRDQLAGAILREREKCAKAGKDALEYRPDLGVIVDAAIRSGE